MGKSNKRDSVKSNRRGPPRVKNRDSNEATGITLEEVIEKIETVLAPVPIPVATLKRTKKQIDDKVSNAFKTNTENKDVT